MGHSLESPINIRPSWDNIFMEFCETLAKRSTCAKLQTAAIIVKENNVVSIGYNGSYSKKKHCINHFYEKFCSMKTLTFWDDYLTTDTFKSEHSLFSHENELHGEMNAITNAAKNNLSSRDATIYTLYSPCINCAKLIISSGLKKVVYKYKYIRENGVELLEKNNIEVIAL